MDDLVQDSEGELRLKNLEEVVEDGVKMIKQGADQIALALLAIQEDGLWRFAKDEDGHYFSSFDRYIRDLADRCGTARSTLFDYKTTARMALANGLATPETYAERGTSYFRQIKNETVLNPATSEIIGVKGVETDHPLEVIQDVVEKVSPALRPMDRRALIKELLHPGQAEMEVYLSLAVQQKGGYHLRYTLYNGTAKKPQEGHIEDGEVPQLVLDELNNRGIRLVDF